MFAAPAWFLDDQFKDETLASNEGAIALCSIIGMLCTVIWTFTYLVRTADCVDDAFLKSFDQATAFAWTLCVVIDVQKKEQYKDAAFQQNMILYAALVGAFLYQASTRDDDKKKK
jgi:hypothetical protein